MDWYVVYCIPNALMRSSSDRSILSTPNKLNLTETSIQKPQPNGGKTGEHLTPLTTAISELLYILF